MTHSAQAQQHLQRHPSTAAGPSAAVVAWSAFPVAESCWTAVAHVADDAQAGHGRPRWGTWGLHSQWDGRGDHPTCKSAWTGKAADALPRKLLYMLH